MNKVSLHSLILAAGFTMVIAVLSQFTTPLGVVPLIEQTFAIGLTVTVLGKRTGTCATLIYFLLGLIGLPVYVGTSSGFGVFFGSAGGYLIGFISNGLLTGYILEKATFNYTWTIITDVAGALVILIFGMIRLKYPANLPWPNAFTSGFALLIVPGIIKAVAAAYVSTLIR